MANTIQIKRGVGKPDSLVEGELAVDTDTGMLYSLVGGVVTELNEQPEDVSLWEQTGSDIYYNTGKVGVGTDAPAAQFEVKGNDNSARFQGAGDRNFLELNFVEQYNEVQFNTNATYLNFAKDGQVGFIFDGSLEGNFLYGCSIGNIKIDGERIRGKGLNGVPGIGLYLSGATHEILPIDAGGNELTEGPDFGNSTYRYKDGHFYGTVTASSFTDLDGNEIGVGDFVPYEERVANEWMAVRTTDFGTSDAITEDGAAVGFNEISVTNGGGGGGVSISSQDGPNGEIVSINTSNNWGNQVPIDMMVSGSGGTSQYVQYPDKFLFDGAPVQAPDYLDADGNSIVYKYDRSHEHAPNIMLNSNMSDEGGIVAKLGGGADSVSLMLSRGKFDPTEDPNVMLGKPDYLYMGPNKRGVPSDLGSYEEPDKRFVNAYFEGKVQAVDFLDAEGNSIVGGGGDVDLSAYVTTDPEEKPYSQYFNGPTQALEWQASGAPYYVSIGQAMEGGIGMGFSPLYVETRNGVYEINSFSFLITGGTVQGKKRRDSNTGEDVYSHIRGFASIQADDFLDADGNSIVQPPVDLTGYATEAYVGQQIAAIPPPAVPDQVTSATRLKGYEHGLVLGSSPGFGGNNLFVLGSNLSGAYESRVMMGNGLSQQFSIMYAANFYKAGSPILSAVDLIDTFTTIKSAITEEQTVEGLRTAVMSGLDAVIAKLQAMEDLAEEEGHKR